MKYSELTEDQKAIADDLARGLRMELHKRFVGKTNNEDTAAAVKDFITYFLKIQIQDGWLPSDVPEPVITINGNQINVSWELK